MQVTLNNVDKVPYEGERRLVDFFSVPHLLIILLVILLLFGARKLPEIGSGLGKGISEFRRSLEPPKGRESQEADEGKQ